MLSRMGVHEHVLGPDGVVLLVFIVRVRLLLVFALIAIQICHAHPREPKLLVLMMGAFLLHWTVLYHVFDFVQCLTLSLLSIEMIIRVRE